MQDDLAEAYKRLAEGPEAERLHLAQELHDGPIQDLYAILFDLDNLHAHDHDSRVRLLALREMTEHVIRALRAICVELRPPSLVPFGLEGAIRSHAQVLRESHPHLDVQFDLMRDHLALPEHMRLALFRIYQEALNNIIQHANAHSIIIRLIIETELVILEIQDNGCGFNVQESWIPLARCGHLGLLGMTERAAALGGHTHIISVLGEGTTVRVIVPRPTTPLHLRRKGELEG